MEPNAVLVSDSAPQSAGVPGLGGAYSVKRHGTTIDNCDLEPVHTPGCIQPHGVLLVLRLSDLTILQVSENAKTHLGLTPEQLLDEPVSAALGLEGQERVREAIDGASVECNPVHVFSFSPEGVPRRLDATFHTLDGLGMLELEPAGCGSAELDYLLCLKSTLTRLQSAQTVGEFCDLLAGELQRLTGLDRVMVYRFHPDRHGEVIAERRREDLPSWLGQHYPAEDVPHQVREVFKRVWIRPLADACAEPAELVPLVNPDSHRPTDLSFCALRGASVMYSEQLRNMGSAASLTMPIRRDGELWGMVTCHQETPFHFGYRMRSVCEFLARAVSLELKPVEEREQMRRRQRVDELHGRLITAAAEGGGALERLIEDAPNLLDGLDAGGAALCQHGRWWRCGLTPDELQLEALADWIEARPELASPLRPIYATDGLSRDYPPGESFAALASGVLATSLCKTHRLLLLWFRPETRQTIRWAGNPSEMPQVPGPNGPRLTPRASFDLFLESVSGRSLPWQEGDIEAVLRLRLWAMELVVDRSQNLAQLNADLAQSNRDLDAFAFLVSYDLREPLRGIARHARRVLKDTRDLEDEPRRHLERVMQLTERMGRLLNAQLGFSRICRIRLEMASVDLNEVVEEALIMAGARRAETLAEVSIPRTFPTLTCDRLRVREVFRALIDNALRYNERRPRWVEVGYLLPGEDQKPRADGAEVPVYYVRDNGLGMDPAYLDRVFELFRRLHGWDAYGGGAGAGLAITRKLVERHGGRVWAESRPGEGSTFYFTLCDGRSETLHG